MDEHRCRVPVDSNFKHVQTILLPLAQIDGYSTDLQLRTYYARKWEIQGLYHLTQWISIYNHLLTTESLYQQEIVEGPFNGSPSSVEAVSVASCWLVRESESDPATLGKNVELSLDSPSVAMLRRPYWTLALSPSAMLTRLSRFTGNQSLSFLARADGQQHGARELTRNGRGSDSCRF